MCRKEVGREGDINKPNVRKPQLFFFSDTDRPTFDYEPVVNNLRSIIH